MTTERVDALIVGAGPAGLASAIELKRRGVDRVMVVDREPEAGGMPRMCHHTGFGVWDFHRLYTGPQYARRYAALARSLGVEIRTETTITGWDNDLALTFTSPGGLGVIAASAILLATGVRERPRSARMIPGFRPRGVFTTGSLQRFVDEQHLPVGQRAVIVGAEGVSLSAFMTLTGAGLDVAAMLTEFPRDQLYYHYAPAKWWLMGVQHRTPVRTSTRVTRILGRKRVDGVEVENLQTGQRQVIPCDTVVFTGDWIPENEVARKRGLEMDAGTKGPRVDGSFHTSRPGVFAAGNLLRGAETAATSAMEGRFAAGHIADFLQGRAWPELRLPILVDAPVTWVFPNSVSPDETATSGKISFRVDRFIKDGRVQVRQGKSILHSQTFRHLLPNETMKLRGGWQAQVDITGEPPRIALAS